LHFAKGRYVMNAISWSLEPLRPARWSSASDCGTSRLDEGRLTRLTREDREILSQRVRQLHGTKSEAWLATRDGTVMGALIIRTVRPDGPR